MPAEELANIFKINLLNPDRGRFDIQNKIALIFPHIACVNYFLERCKKLKPGICYNYEIFEPEEGSEGKSKPEWVVIIFEREYYERVVEPLLFEKIFIDPERKLAISRLFQEAKDWELLLKR